jgi:hypothetical protein
MVCMKKSLVVALLVLGGLVGNAANAEADITFFLGFHASPHTQSVRGVAAGVNLLIVGFEFEYGLTREDTTVGKEAPGLQTGMFNFLIQTPTSVSLYATVGGGVYREDFAPSHVTNFATNVGGGVKFPLFGPLKVRVDYRIFALRGSPQVVRWQRLYAGVNWAF